MYSPILSGEKYKRKRRKKKRKFGEEINSFCVEFFLKNNRRF